MSMLSQWLKTAERTISSWIPHTHSRDARAQRYKEEAQRQYYEEATNQLREEKEKLKSQKDAEHRRRQEKQIRNLRGRFRPSPLIRVAGEDSRDTVA